MSELMNFSNDRGDFRCRLLATASAMALLGSVYAASEANASGDENGRPSIWIELGGQLEQQSGLGEAFAPPFIADNPLSPAYKPVSPLQSGKPPLFSNGGEAALLFEPDGSDWVFSASIRYGRSNSNKNVEHKTLGPREKWVLPNYYPYTVRCCRTNYITPSKNNFSQTQAKLNQSHSILDFRAGRDVGLGMFVGSTTSLVSAGVRFAQFVSNVKETVQARPDVENVKRTFGYGPYQFYRQDFHTFAASIQAARSFRGVGPSIAWDASVPFLGNMQSGELTFDWGANAAVLFGRQKVSGHHQTSGHYVRGSYHGNYYQTSKGFGRVRTVTVPNVGGFAGVSFKFPNAKVSFGYRSDLFFGAMDAGNDTRKTETVGFFGPFASISVGIGG